MFRLKGSMVSTACNYFKVYHITNILKVNYKELFCYVSTNTEKTNHKQRLSVITLSFLYGAPYGN